MPSTGGGLQLPDFEDFPGFKGGGGSGYIPPGGSGGTPPSGSIFGPAGGAGSPLTGIGAPYDRSVPQFGYRRKPLGPVGNSRTTGAVASPGAAAQAPMQGFGPQAGPSWYGGGQAPSSSDWTIPQYLQNAQGAGAFDPMGSQGILSAIAAQYGQGYGQAQRGVRNGLLASGVDDPNAYAYGQLQGDLNAQGQYSNALQNAQLQSMLQNQGFLQNVFGSNQNFAQGNYQQGTLERFSNNHNPSAWSQIAGLLGQVGGQALGAYTGGMMGRH